MTRSSLTSPAGLKESDIIARFRVGITGHIQRVLEFEAILSVSDLKETRYFLVGNNADIQKTGDRRDGTHKVAAFLAYAR